MEVEYISVSLEKSVERRDEFENKNVGRKNGRLLSRDLFLFVAALHHETRITKG